MSCGPMPGFGSRPQRRPADESGGMCSAAAAGRTLRPGAAAGVFDMFERIIAAVFLVGSLYLILLLEAVRSAPA